MRKNKSMLTKTVFYGLGVSLVIGSLVVPLGMDMLNQNVANNTLVRENAPANEEIKIVKNSSVDYDVKEQPFSFSPIAANQDLVKLFDISENGRLTVKDKTNLENYLKSHEGKLDLNELGNGVKIISERCFENIAELTTITISESVTEIGSLAFYKCKNLKKITIPASVNRIGSGIFDECWNLNSTNVTNNSSVLFDWWVKNHEYKVNNVTTTMSKISVIDLYEFENSVNGKFNVIDNRAFLNCENLTNITIPEQVKKIGDSAFFNCKNLKKVTFQGNNKDLHLEFHSFWTSSNTTYLFESWDLFSRLEETDQFKSSGIDENNCTITVDKSFVLNGQGTLIKLTDEGKQKALLNIPDLIKTIASNAFQGSQAITISISASVIEIGEEAFYKCHKLENVIFQGEDRSFTLANNAFQDTDIKFFYFEDQRLLDKLCDTLGKNKCRLNDGDFVFNASKVLVGLTKSGKQKETLTIPNSVKTIGGSVFEKNEKLIDIIIPASVEKIDGNAFLSCSKLTRVTFEGNNPNLTLGDNAFPKSVEHFYFENEELFNRLKNLENAGIAENKCIVTVGKWFVVEGNNTLTNLTEEGKKQKELKIPSFVTKVGDGAFQGSQALTITVADSVTVIGNNAFSDCSKLESIRFGNQQQLQQIGENAFSGCLKLINIILPTSLTTIGAGAFKDCTSLTSIVIPGLVSEIGARAFDDCNHLESVTFLGGDRKFSLGKEVFPQNINQFYFNDKNLFNSLRFETSAGIISSKCVLVQKYFEIKDDNSLIAITSDAQELSELRIPGFVKTIGNGINVVFGEFAKFQKVIIPTSVDKIKANAFNGCSSLKEVIINSTDITIESNAFVNMPNTQYYVPANADVKEQLKKIGIKESQIYFLNLSAISIDYATIGIIVGAIVFSIIALGLGIGIPMRKQHRINVLNAKITRNRVDKLAAASALSFKKVLEVSARTNRKIDKLEAQNRLIATNVTRPVNRFSQPNRPTNPKPPIKKPAKN